MTISHTILGLLGDMKYHSGNLLARELDVSRTTVWKAVLELKKRGVSIESRHGKGYRLLQAVELLDIPAISAELAYPGVQLEVFSNIDSTNRYLLRQLGEAPVHKRVVLAEQQREGRGRRGKTWVSPFAAGLYLSIAWHFNIPPASLNALSLASGVALAETLEQAGIQEIGLKWPNDLVINNAKIAGILIESRSETAVSCDVIVGIGVNMMLDSKAVASIDQPVTDLARVSSSPLSRNSLAAGIIDGQARMLDSIATRDPGIYIRKWRKYDALAGKSAWLDTGKGPVTGMVKGVDNNGLLVMVINGTEKKFSSGEVSLRGQG